MLNFEIAACFKLLLLTAQSGEWLWLCCGPGMSVAAQHCWGHGGRAAGKDQGDTGPILEGEKSNSILDLFFYVSEKKIKSTL